MNIDPHHMRWNGVDWVDLFAVETGGSWSTDLRTERYDTQGRFLAGSTRVIVPHGLRPHLAWNGTGFGLAYLEEFTGNYETARFLRLDATGGVIPGSDLLLASSVTASMDFPMVAWDPINAEYGLTWVNRSNQHVFFQRRDATGQPLSPVITLTQLAWGAHESSGGTPVRSFNGTWAVVFADDQTTLALIDRQNALTRVAIANTDLRGLSLAHDGTTFAITGCEPVVMPGYTKCRATFLRATAQGVVPNSRVTLGTMDFDDSAAVEWTGVDWLVTWNEAHIGGGFGDVWTERISSTGQVLPGSRQRLTCSDNNGLPRLIWTGSEARVTWLKVGSLTRQREFVRIP
ncbi:MAG: hypothetical protein Q8L48_34910 [Archangium sp.]|nr:hypothetical protein [Archangium sp.]